MVVGPHKANLNVYFWHDWMKDDVTVTSQRIQVTMLGCQLGIFLSLITPDSFVGFP